jgi:hypothetical protein
MHPWWLFSYVYLYLSDSHMYASVSVNFLAQIVSLYIAQAGGSAGTGASGVGAREQRGLGRAWERRGAGMSARRCRRAKWRLLPVHFFFRKGKALLIFKKVTLR